MYGDGFVDISAVCRCLAGMKVMMVQLSNKRQKPAIETVIKYISVRKTLTFFSVLLDTGHFLT